MSRDLKWVRTSVNKPIAGFVFWATVANHRFFKLAERSKGCSSQTLLACNETKERLQIKIANDYYWIGAEENLGKFS